MIVRIAATSVRLMRNGSISSAWPKPLSRKWRHADRADDGDRVVHQGDDGRRGVLQVAEPEPDVDHDDEDRDQRGHERLALGVAGDLRIEVADLLELGLACRRLRWPASRSGRRRCPSSPRRSWRRRSPDWPRARRLLSPGDCPRRRDLSPSSRSTSSRNLPRFTCDPAAAAARSMRSRISFGAIGGVEVPQHDRRAADVARRLGDGLAVDLQRVLLDRNHGRCSAHPSTSVARLIELARHLDLQLGADRLQHARRVTCVALSLA